MRSVTLIASREVPVALSCAVSTCRRPLYNAMFCQAHALKQREYANASVAPMRPLHDQGCVIQGCRQRARRGLCVAHRRELSAGNPTIMATLLLACRGYAAGQRCACGRTGAVWKWDGTGRKEDVRRWIPVCSACVGLRVW